jgi:hypothetical protein
MLADLDDRFARLSRGQSKTRFADLDPGRAANLARKDAHVLGLISMSSRDRYASVQASSGTPPHSPGAFRIEPDPGFWTDEGLIRRVAVALIDFWRADQAVVYAPDLMPQVEGERRPWCFWLDWRRDDDMPTLLSTVPVSGQPSIERKWHGGVERLWPEHEPWRPVQVPAPA